MTNPTLSDRQLLLLRASGFDDKDGRGFGFPLRGARNWRTARSLVKRDLGWIEGGAPNGSALEGLFFANQNGTAIAFPEDLEAWLQRKGLS